MRAVAVVILVLLAWPALGQEPGKQAPKPAPKRTDSELPPPDPTKPSPDLRKALEAGKTGAAGPRLLPINLKARLLLKDKPPVALIEVDGRVIPVSPGNTITLTGGVSLKVFAITATEVEIVVSPYEERIILR